MRLQVLHLKAFGPFTDVELNLSEGDPGLHIVYGPNEAGKSSTMRAIENALFGYPSTCPDTHVHAKPLVGLTLCRGDETLQFWRKKSTKQSLFAADCSTPLPERILQQYLQGINKATYRHLYGVDAAEFQRGGEAMRQLEGLTGESLFAAGLGGSGLTKALLKLDVQSMELFHSKKRTSQLKANKKRYDELLKERRDSTVPFNRWIQIQKKLELSLDGKQQVAHQIEKLRSEERRLRRIRSTLNLLAQRDRLQQQRQELAGTTVLPADYSSEERSRIEGELAQLSPLIERHKTRLDGPHGLRNDLKQLHVPEPLLLHEAEILRLQEWAGATMKGERDRDTKLVRERDEAIAQTRQILQDWQLNSTWDQVESLRIPPTQVLRIQNLASEAQQRLNAPLELQRQHEQLKQQLQQIRNQLAETDTLPDILPLAACVKDLQRLRDLPATVDRSRRAYQMQQKNATDLLTRLPLWHGSLTELISIPVPMEETVDAINAEWVTLEQGLEQIEREIEDLSTEKSDLQAELGTLEQTRRVPTEEDLLERRDVRNQAWEEIREHWLNTSGRPKPSTLPVAAGATTEHELARQFEQHLHAADEIADRLRREAERVERRAQLRSQCVKVERLLSEQTVRRSEQQERQSLQQLAWRKLWADCRVEHPRPPVEMRKWLRLLGEVRKQAEELQKQEELLAEQEQLLSASCLQLGNLLKGRIDPPVVAPSLSILLDIAEAYIQDVRRQEQTRRELTKERLRLEQELAQVDGAREIALQLQAAWKTHWAEAMGWLGCSVETTAAEANERVEAIHRVVERGVQAKDRVRRIQDITAEAHEFTTQVAAVWNACGLDPDSKRDLTPYEQALRLRQLLEQAQSTRARREQLQLEISQTEREIHEKESVLRQCNARLQQLCHVAGGVSLDALPEMEKASQRRIETEAKLDEIESQLLEQGGGLSLEQLATEAADHHVDSLDARLVGLDQELRDLELRREDIAGTVRELQYQAEAMGGEPKSAEADQAALGLLSRMHRDAARFATLRLAHAMLQSQIERHREENEDPVLSTASDLFSRMTCGEFVGVESDFEHEKSRLKGQRRTGERVDIPFQMSSGTRDQLYLALRLGYLLRRTSEFGPMPLLVDDILVHFDDTRAAATLKVLAEVGERMQVILFTHHDRIVQLADEHVPRGKYFVQRLRCRSEGTPIETNTP